MPPMHLSYPRQEGPPPIRPRQQGAPPTRPRQVSLLTVQMEAEKVPPPLPLSDSPASRDGHSQPKRSLLHFRPPAPPMSPVTAGPPDTHSHKEAKAPLLFSGFSAIHQFAFTYAQLFCCSLKEPAFPGR